MPMMRSSNPFWCPYVGEFYLCWWGRWPWCWSLWRCQRSGWLPLLCSKILLSIAKCHLATFCVDLIFNKNNKTAFCSACSLFLHFPVNPQMIKGERFCLNFLKINIPVSSQLQNPSLWSIEAHAWCKIHNSSKVWHVFAYICTIPHEIEYHAYCISGVIKGAVSWEIFFHLE